MPRKRTDADIYVATESFECELDGERILVTKDERVRAGHPLLRAQPAYFEPADTTVRYDVVEQATAAPGELRGAANA